MYDVKVYSVLQVAEILGCKRRKVFELLADGTLERAPRYGREIRIYAESVNVALAPQRDAVRKARAHRVATERINPADIPI